MGRDDGNVLGILLAPSEEANSPHMRRIEPAAPHRPRFAGPNRRSWARAKTRLPVSLAIARRGRQREDTSQEATH